MSDIGSRDDGITVCIGERIRHWRRRRAMSQDDVARDIGITQATLSNYELGKRDPSISTLLAIAGTLNVSLGELIGSREIIVPRRSALGRAIEELQNGSESTRQGA